MILSVCLRKIIKKNIRDKKKQIRNLKEKLYCILSSTNFSTAKEKSYSKIVYDIFEDIKSLQFNVRWLVLIDWGLGGPIGL